MGGRGQSAAATNAQGTCFLPALGRGPEVSFCGTFALFSLPGTLSQGPQILQVSPKRIQPGVPDYRVLNSKSNHLPHTLSPNASDWYLSVVLTTNRHIYIGALCGLVQG